MASENKKISTFSESLEKKSVGEIPPTQTARPQIVYPSNQEKQIKIK